MGANVGSLQNVYLLKKPATGKKLTVVKKRFPWGISFGRSSVLRKKKNLNPKYEPEEPSTSVLDHLLAPGKLQLSSANGQHYPTVVSTGSATAFKTTDVPAVVLTDQKFCVDFDCRGDSEMDCMVAVLVVDLRVHVPNVSYQLRQHEDA
ncbi:hypothetical protein DAPPUDRAFT_111513 [Daphnia pulex]|uniref:Uncharacterized protein n=1 Tax=Daphnia pulex TaxID=6669 RepID=E9H9G6_DAPPU|nr:hypothetical protein DAPPUDRAFT_111512 [Daphnia pulex]EFX71655.1 hypothetical protein DAPPUDRAFT_111513 [Daphnia pulex]|eukprot:EFX71614.1 hypothetical protein DAPPUDRAFT_111512 [Daphnia pulex]